MQLIKQQISGQSFENAFMNPNLGACVLKTITSIIHGVNIKQNEKRLYKLRDQSQYSLILCETLATLNKGCLMGQNTIESKVKNLIALQIKKNVNKLTNKQCWWLLRDVYYSGNDKTAKLVRQICLSYVHLSRERDNQNFIGLFFSVNLQNFGYVGIVRYLLIVHALINEQIKNIQKQAIIKYGEQITLKILQFLHWDLTPYMEEFSLTNLILLQEFSGGKNYWKDLNQLNFVLDKLINNRQKSLTKFLATYLKEKINFQTQNLQSSLKLSLLDNSIVNFRNKLILGSIQECLSIIEIETDLSTERQFYVDCLSIVDHYWTMNLKYISLESEDQNISSFIGQVIAIFYTHFKKSYSNDQKFSKILDLNEDIQQDKQLIEAKKTSILSSILNNITKLKLKSIISMRASYEITIMQLSLHLPVLPINSQLISSQQFKQLLCQLISALQNQSDAYLFYKQKQQFIDTVLRYIVKHRTVLEKNIILEACYLIDYLAFKCDPISANCYQILDLLSQESSYIQDFQLVEFLQRSLTNINSNLWQESTICYNHIINIILNLSPYLILSKDHQSLYRIQQLSLLQQHILTMIKRLISAIKENFNYDIMHKLNSLLEFLLYRQATHLCKFLTDDQISDTVNANFQYQIFTQSSEQVYFYFCQSSRYQENFVTSANLYKFWENCQSEKLQFFVSVYLKFIDSKTLFFTSSEAQHKLIELKKNLWHRFVSERDQDERQKIVHVFQKHPKYLSELTAEFYKVKFRGKIENANQNCSKKSNLSTSYNLQKMELQ